MLDRSLAGTVTFRASATLLLSLVLCLAASEASPVLATAHSAGRTCSTAGLRFTEKRGGVTDSVKVVDLRAQVVSCASGRSLASQVAQDLLREVKVPKRIDGLKVTLKKPCTGCTPNTAVTAKSGRKAVTFTVEGGA